VVRLDAADRGVNELCDVFQRVIEHIFQEDTGALHRRKRQHEVLDCTAEGRPGRIDREFRDRAGHECGAIPSKMVVVVIDRHPKEKPSYRIYRPADLYLNGTCTDANGYYIEQNNLDPL